MRNKHFYLALMISALAFFYSCNQPTQKSNTENQQTGVVTQPKDSVVLAKEKLNDIAKFIAGIPVEQSSFLYEYTQTPEWTEYSAESKTAWARFDAIARKYNAFSKSEILPPYDTVSTLFYPFSGPDFLFADIMFPNVKKMILIGLESPGTVPQIDSTTKDSLNKVLSLYRVAIEDVIQLSFFRTIDMKNELGNKAIDGTAPIIMLFLAKNGKEIIDVRPMYLNNEGIPVIIKNGDKKHQATAIEILYKDKGNDETKSVLYLSTNLADPALSKDKPFYNYLKKLDNRMVTFVKSATYLMHKSYFSIIRNTCLKKSIMILQDDSGIGFKFFDQNVWNINLYGTYTKPIKLFEDFFEPDYLEAFKTGKSKPLKFRIGYSPKSNLLMAMKKELN
jgi:hypothetical protein